MATKFEWTKNAILHFTKILKEHPFMWNVKSKEYKMKNNRSFETIKTIYCSGGTSFHVAHKGASVESLFVYSKVTFL